MSSAPFYPPFLDNLSQQRIKFTLLDVLNDDVLFNPIEQENLFFLKTIKEIISILNKSSLARSLLHRAAQTGLSVGQDPLLEPDNSYFYALQNHFDLGYQPMILQKTEKGMSRYILSFIHGLRYAVQADRGYGHNIYLKPNAFLRFYRLMEADAAAVTHAIAWELRRAGVASPWRALLLYQGSDMTDVFENSVATDPTSLLEGEALNNPALNAHAMQSVFHQWFKDTARVSVSDHEALEVIDLALLQGKIGFKNLPASKIWGLGILPQGSNYLQGIKMDQKWYQVPPDPINRAHLSHIQQDVINAMKNHQTTDKLP